MSGDTVSYRYGRDELCALAQVLKKPLQGIDLPALNESAFHDALSTLEAAGLVTPAADRVGVDRLTALLVNEMAKCDRCAAFRSGGRATILWQGPHLILLGTYGTRGPVSLTPLQTPDDAAEALSEALLRHPMPLTVAETGPNRPQDPQTLASKEDAEAFVTNLIDRIRRVSVF